MEPSGPTWYTLAHVAPGSSTWGQPCRSGTSTSTPIRTTCGYAAGPDGVVHISDDVYVSAGRCKHGELAAFLRNTWPASPLNVDRIPADRIPLTQVPPLNMQNRASRAKRKDQRDTP
jgi:hypothetical protein